MYFLLAKTYSTSVQVAVLKENMNIDVRVIGITGASRMLLSDTYATESSLAHPLCQLIACLLLSGCCFYATKSGCCPINLVFW
jgi:hypothetical protein